MVTTDNAKHVFLAVAKLMFTKHIIIFEVNLRNMAFLERIMQASLKKFARKIAGFQQETMKSIFKRRSNAVWNSIRPFVSRYDND